MYGLISIWYMNNTLNHCQERDAKEASKNSYTLVDSNEESIKAPY